MKNKIILILIIFLVLTGSVNAVTLNPLEYFKGKLTGSLMSKWPADVQQAINIILNPKGAFFSEVLSKNTKLAGAISQFNSIKNIIDKIPEDKRPGIKITDKGKTIITSPDGKTEELSYEIAGSDKTFWNPANYEETNNERVYTFTRDNSVLVGDKKTGPVNENINKKRNARCKDTGSYNKDLSLRSRSCDTIKINDVEISIVNQAGTVKVLVDKKTNQKTIIIEDIQNDGSAFVVAGKDKNTKLNYVGKGVVIKLDKSNNLVYASFKSTASGESKSNIFYNGKNYEFNIKNKGNLLFDPQNADGKGSRIEAIGDITLTLGNNQYISKNGFNIWMKDGNIIRIDYPLNGIFIDKNNQIQATSSMCFSICLTADSCNAGTNTKCEASSNSLKNTLRITKGKNLVELVSAGQINYQVGEFIKVQAISGSKTQLVLTSNHIAYFQVMQGKAVIQKESVVFEVVSGKGKECGKECGDSAKFSRRSMTIKESEALYILDYSCGTCMQYVSPTGGVGNYNKITGKITGGWVNPKQQSKQKITDYGAMISSREVTIVAILDSLTQDLVNYRESLDAKRWWQVLTGAWERYQPIRYLVEEGNWNYQGRMNAIEELYKRGSQLQTTKNFILIGDSFEEAAKKAELDFILKEGLSKSINNKGNIVPEEMLALASRISSMGAINDRIRLFNQNQAYYFAKLAKEYLLTENGVYNKNSLTYQVLAGTHPYADVNFNDNNNIVLCITGHPEVDLLNPSAPAPKMPLTSGKIFSSMLHDRFSKFFKFNTRSDKNTLAFLKSLKPTDVKKMQEERKRLIDIGNSKPIFKKQLAPTLKKIDLRRLEIERDEFLLNVVDVLDLIPIGVIAKYGSLGVYKLGGKVKIVGRFVELTDGATNVLNGISKSIGLARKDIFQTSSKFTAEYEAKKLAKLNAKEATQAEKDAVARMGDNAEDLIKKAEAATKKIISTGIKAAEQNAKKMINEMPIINDLLTTESIRNIKIEIGGSNARRALNGKPILVRGGDFDITIIYPTGTNPSIKSMTRGEIKNILKKQGVHLDDGYAEISKHIATFTADEVKINLKGQIIGSQKAIEDLVSGTLELTPGNLIPSTGIRAARRLQDGTAITILPQTKMRISKTADSLFKDISHYKKLDNVERLKQELKVAGEGAGLDSQLYKILKESNNPRRTLSLFYEMGYGEGLSKVGYNLDILKGTGRKLTEYEIKSFFKNLKKYDINFLEILPINQRFATIRTMDPSVAYMFDLKEEAIKNLLDLDPDLLPAL